MKSSLVNTSPLRITGKGETASIISANLSHSALFLLRMSLVLQCTVIALTPVLAILFTSSIVSCCDGKRRIFAVTGRDKLSTKFDNIEHSKSGLYNKDAPIPPLIENFFGQPQFKSTPDTSFSLFFLVLK
ncbi:hypothetical protein AYI70_g6475 [Smittium culicis]|uniref:Uncharacterized protein n=1 Tax=Smittium culicis TaxID=133412 RepID=A0A1R1XPT5_9FUNG|nr:hypothetical protein AYI70_g6475 [Smittium culicis]